MARRSRKKNLQALSAFLFLAVAGLVTAGVINVRDDDFLTGVQLIGWAFVPLAILLGFTWPVRCRVKTTRRTACGNNAYGLLFGCSKTVGHWTGKFLARIGLPRDDPKPVERRQSAGNATTMYQPPSLSQSQPIRVTVEDNGLGICGFWVGVVSALAGVLQVITVFTIH